MGGSVNTHERSLAHIWILLEAIETTTLHDLAKQRALVVKEDLVICLKLIQLVKDIHNRGVVHRTISPKNILINYDDSMTPDQIQLCLIDFDYAWIEQPDEDDSLVWDPAVDLSANSFYHVPQFETPRINRNSNDKIVQKPLAAEQRSRTIDTSSTCAILFWLLTKREPRCSRTANGQAPHSLSDAQGIIDSQIKSVAG